MSLSGKYVSIYTIIEDVFRDNDYDDVPLHDAVEWAGKAMDRIGVKQGYEDAPIAIIDIANNRGQFPCDMTHLTQMRHWPTLAPMVETADNFAGPRAVTAGSEDKEISRVNVLSLLSYKRDGEYFYPAFDDGQVELSYKRLPVDENGFPKIPADTKYADAISAFIQMKLDFRDWRKNKISGAVYAESKDNWSFKAGQAKNKALIPDTVDQWQSLRNQFVRLIPNMKFHATGFANSNVMEQRVNNPSGISRNGLR